MLRAIFSSVRRAPATVILEATITCPFCRHRRSEAMPTDACLHFYECTACRKMLKPRPGDCCVFCSYGSAKCPPRQQPTGEPGRPDE